MADQLPLEIMHDIFSRTPVKSLARFRCVSKLWCNYINDSSLETMHAAKRAASNDPMLIMFHQFPSHDLNSPCKLSFIEHKDQETGANRTLEVRKKPPVMEFMSKGRSFIKYPTDIVLGSCNGLLYSSKCRHNDLCNTLVVINPLRKECYELPPITPPINRLHGIVACYSWGGDQGCVDKVCGLGFDKSTNTFKMVSVMLTEHVWSLEFYRVDVRLCAMVHVLGTDSWRKIPQLPSYSITGEGVFANGCLHWLTHNDHQNFFGRSVISFDMASEEFGLINPPQGKRSDRYNVEQLVDLHGEVGYVCNIVDYDIKVWVLKERGWVMHCEFEQKPPLPKNCIKVLGFWNEDGDILMTDIWKHMFVYHLNSDSDSDKVSEVSFVGLEEKPPTDIRIYLSSLFSTRYSIKN